MSFNPINRRENERVIPTLIFLQVGIVMASAGTPMSEQYAQLNMVIEDVLAMRLPVHVAPDVVLAFHELPPEERALFLHGYENVHAAGSAFVALRGAR